MFSSPSESAPARRANQTPLTVRNANSSHRKPTRCGSRPNRSSDAFALDWGPNWEIHENAFWEQHAYMGMREDMYARSGPASFSLDTTRERIPTGSTHHYQ